MRAVFFVLLLLPFVIPVLVDDAFAADWYSTSWEYRKKIEISLNSEISSDLSNFPVLVSVTDSDFIKATESDGTDIIFTANDGTTRLAHEIERYNTSTGEVIAWVKIPTLSASTGTDIYIYYKGIVEIDASSVWDDNYRLVYHLNQTSTGTVDEFTDVSDTGNDGTGGGTGDMTQDEDRRPTQVEGKIGYGQRFGGPTNSNGNGNDGTGDYIWSQDVSEWPGNNAGTSDNDTTVEFWAKIDDDHSDEGNMDFFGYHASGNHNEFALFKVASLNLIAKGSLLDSDVDATTSDWTYLMIVYDPGGTSKIYQDGELVEQVDGTSGNKGQRHNGEFVLGADVDKSSGELVVNNELQGDLDEFRISDTVRSADWAAASYATQNSPSTYLTLNCEENSTTKNCDDPDTAKDRSGACGFDRDCTPPRITNHGESETPDGFSINNNVFVENQELFNKNPTIQGTVGEPVTIKVRTWENMGTDKIYLAIAYLAMHDEKPDWRDSTAFIEYHIAKNQVMYQDDDDIFLLTGASSEKVEDPYGDNEALELLDITFTIIFAKPMESSHIGIQTIDHITNYDLVYFENALEILPKEIVQVEVIPEEIPEEVPESQPKVIPEEIPEPEPPAKEPEPEVMLTTINEKTVLEFVDESMPAKHYVKRYITETEYKEWFDVNYSEYKFWEGIGITQERFDQIVLEIQSEPKPKMIQTGFVLVPDDQKSLPLVEETYEPEPAELEPVKEEKKGFFDWLFALFG